ncbi:MAG TPA: homoserine dehydrogenase [Acidimicrobiales bacterium]|nr:homoserine dehydrogenase [Acidimicrobiales bacterium]
MAPSSERVVRIAVLGCGNVGAALVAILAERAEALAVQSGARLEVAGIAVHDVTRARDPHVPVELLTDDAAALVADPSVDVVVELVGGVTPADQWVRAALEAGKPVVTANKALLASPEGVALRSLAHRQGVDLLYEAAVAGAIPLIRALRESLTGERIHRVMGIVNGTTNFILTKMSEQGADYADVLAEAQALGLAEKDPTADVEGYDAAAKAAILAGVAFGYDVAGSDVMREGITAVRAIDVEFAERLGYAVKLLAIVERIGDDALSVRVHPAMVPRSHPLAGVRDAFNAVFIEGEAAGELMLYGQGAGGLPTASAVVGDLIDAVRNRQAGTTAPTPERMPARLLPEEDLCAQYYVSVDVVDRSGVLAAVTKVFGDHDVSIRSMEQEGHAGDARLLFVTHVAREGDVRATLAVLADLDAVEEIGGVMRIIGDGE